MIALLLVALAIVVLTWLLGWWAVPLAAFVAGAVLAGRRGIAWLVAIAAAGAWGAILLFDAARGRLPVLAHALGDVMRIPAAALIAITLLFAALLAWGAAVIGTELGRLVRPR